MSAPSRPRVRGDRVEGVVQVLILLAIGSMAAAASFTHVHNVAAAHGQPGWLAWADAVVIELMSIATGLEIRRRHRGMQPAGFVLGVLVAAVVLSLSAQVVEAERSVVGWLAAALPALGFLALVKVVLSRTPIQRVESTPVPGEAATDPSSTGADLAGTIIVPAPSGEVGEQGGNQDEAADLLDQARRISAAYLAEHGRPITRDQLRVQLRTSTNTATVLHQRLRQDGRPGLVPVPAAAFTRANQGANR
jgi:Protein of unknown function (DUF2637)